MTEDQLHKLVADWLRLHLPSNAIAHHSMNEGARGWKTQAKMKKFGVIKGWPDIEIIHDGRAYFIELKAPGILHGNTMKGRGYLTPEQRGCHQLLREAGAAVETCWSLEDVKEVLWCWGIINSKVAA